MAITDQEIAEIVRQVLKEQGSALLTATSCDKDDDLIPIGVSNHHIHLSAADFATLFGPDAEMTHFKDLSQPGQFACKETMTLVGPAGVVEHVRLLGPARKQTQVEVSVSDCFKLGIQAPLRESGDLANSAALTIVGPRGSVTIPEGAIIAVNHIHMHTRDAARWGLQDKDRVNVKTCTPRGLIFLEVLCRVSDQFALEMHVDLDEANAASLKNGDQVKLLGKA